MDIASPIATSWRDLYLERAPVNVLIETLKNDSKWPRASFHAEIVEFVQKYKQYPPHPSWFKYLMKVLVEELEKVCDDGLEDSLAELAVDAALTNVSSDDAVSFYVMYNLYAPGPLPFRLLKGHNQVGTIVWAAGKYMCGVLHLFGGLTCGKRVLELGSGTGVVGISIASDPTAQPRECILTDFHDEVLVNLQHNVAINAETTQPTSMTVSQLDWRSFDASAYSDNVDVILAADCTYAPDIVTDLLLALSKLLPVLPRNNEVPSTEVKRISFHGVSKIAVVAATVRDPDTFAGFMLGLSENRFRYFELSRDELIAQGLQASFAALGNELDIRIICILGQCEK